MSSCQTFQDESNSGSDNSDSDEELFDNTGVKEGDIQSGKVSDASDDESHYISPTPPKKTAPKPKKPVVFNSDSEDEKPNGKGNGFTMNGDSDSEEEMKKKKKAAPKKAAKKLTSSDDLFDSMMSNGDKKPPPKKKATKKKLDSDAESGSDFDSKPKKAPAKKAAGKKPAKKAKIDSDGSESDFNMDDVAPARDRPGTDIANLSD